MFYKGLIQLSFLLAVSNINASIIEDKLGRYQVFLENGTYGNTPLPTQPKTRYYTFLKAFKHFQKYQGRTVLELGTSRSYVHGGLPGCNSNDIKYWNPDRPEGWDWGAGFFTRMAAECLIPLGATIYTVDLASDHIARCKVMTSEFKANIRYIKGSSIDILKSWDVNHKIDLIYLDTGDMTPIEPTAELQLEEAKIIVVRNLLAKNGILLIDDVKNPTP